MKLKAALLLFIGLTSYTITKSQSYSVNWYSNTGGYYDSGEQRVYRTTEEDPHISYGRNLFDVSQTGELEYCISGRGAFTLGLTPRTNICYNSSCLQYAIYYNPNTSLLEVKENGSNVFSSSTLELECLKFDNTNDTLTILADDSVLHETPITTTDLFPTVMLEEVENYLTSVSTSYPSESPVYPVIFDTVAGMHYEINHSKFIVFDMDSSGYARSRDKWETQETFNFQHLDSTLEYSYHILELSKANQDTLKTHEIHLNIDKVYQYIDDDLSDSANLSVGEEYNIITNTEGNKIEIYRDGSLLFSANSDNSGVEKEFRLLYHVYDKGNTLETASINTSITPSYEPDFSSTSNCTFDKWRNQLCVNTNYTNNQTGAYSSHSLPQGEDGFVTYTIENTQSAVAFGLSTTDESQAPGTIEYSFYLDQGTGEVQESGSKLVEFSYTTGDQLELIINSTGDLYFYKNGYQLRRVTPEGGINNPLYLDVSLNNAQSCLTGLKCSFAPEVSIETRYYSPWAHDKQAHLKIGLKHHTAEDLVMTWRDSLFINQQEYDSLYYYYESYLTDIEDDTSANPYENLSYGEYLALHKNEIKRPLPGVRTITIKDTNLNTLSEFDVPITTKAVADSLSGGTFSNNTFEKTASSGWTDGVMSLGNLVFSEDSTALKGGLSFKIDTGTTEGVVGLSDPSASIESSTNGIEFGVHFADGSIQVIKNEAIQEASYSYNSNEPIAIYRDGGKLRLYKSGEELDNMNEASSSATYRIDLKLKDPEDKIIDIDPVTPYWPVISKDPNNEYCGTYGEMIDLSITDSEGGGSTIDPPIQYSSISYQWWDNDNATYIAGQTQPTISGLSPGSYNLDICFNFASGGGSCIPGIPYYVGYKAEWYDLINAQVLSPYTNSIQNNSSGNSSAKTTNMLPANLNGWYAFKITTDDWSTTKSQENNVWRYHPYLRGGRHFDKKLSLPVCYPYPLPTLLPFHYKLGLKDGSNNNRAYVFVQPLLTGEALVQLHNNQSSSMDQILVEGEQWIRVKVDNTANTLDYEINGEDLTPNINLTSFIFSDPSSLYFEMSGNMGSRKTGPKRVITSFSCPNPVYQKLTRELDGQYYHTMAKNLFFYTDRHYNDGQLNYNLYKDENGQQTIVPVTPTVENLGDNRYQLIAKNIDEGYYWLEVTNEKGEKKYLRFYNKY
ncbi:hypothetical protein [Salibacter halophilus]|uniref:Uncharacterized protein n=1 Tax=Salibacter halophilus TaxID=1803916 RepID=A0A6N6M9J4_9FLAO|nr:hypothetical protein [Salibacter halophilus]KAB1064892.1 hypothetical protein F3059_05940 [Salibacter halophilus]